MPPRSESAFQADSLREEDEDQFYGRYAYADPDEVAVGRPGSPAIPRERPIAPIDGTWGRDMTRCHDLGCWCHAPESRLWVRCGLCGCQPWGWRTYEALEVICL